MRFGRCKGTHFSAFMGHCASARRLIEYGLVRCDCEGMEGTDMVEIPDGLRTRTIISAMRAGV